MVIAPAASSQTGRCVRCMRAPTNWPPTGPMARIVGREEERHHHHGAKPGSADDDVEEAKDDDGGDAVHAELPDAGPTGPAPQGAICRVTAPAASCRGRVLVLD